MRSLCLLITIIMALAGCASGEAPIQRSYALSGELFADSAAYQAVWALHEGVGHSALMHHRCNATLIAPRVAITAAHCLLPGPANESDLLELQGRTVALADRALAATDDERDRRSDDRYCSAPETWGSAMWRSCRVPENHSPRFQLVDNGSAKVRQIVGWDILSSAIDTPKTGQAVIDIGIIYLKGQVTLSDYPGLIITPEDHAWLTRLKLAPGIYRPFRRITTVGTPEQRKADAKNHGRALYDVAAAWGASMAAFMWTKYDSKTDKAYVPAGDAIELAMLDASYKRRVGRVRPFRVVTDDALGSRYTAALLRVQETINPPEGYSEDILAIKKEAWKHSFPDALTYAAAHPGDSGAPVFGPLPLYPADKKFNIQGVFSADRIILTNKEGEPLMIGHGEDIEVMQFVSRISRSTFLWLNERLMRAANADPDATKTDPVNLELPDESVIDNPSQGQSKGETPMTAGGPSVVASDPARTGCTVTSASPSNFWGLLFVSLLCLQRRRQRARRPAAR